MGDPYSDLYSNSYEELAKPLGGVVRASRLRERAFLVRVPPERYSILSSFSELRILFLSVFHVWLVRKQWPILL